MQGVWQCHANGGILSVYHSLLVAPITPMCYNYIEVISVIIYKIKNKTNGKIYIGQTVRGLQERISEHARKKQTIMGKAIKKYGIENFSIEIIDRAEDIEELNAKETKWIIFYNCMVPNGYNQCYGGNNTKGYTHKDESKKKMSASKKKMYVGENNPFFGKTHSPEQIAKWRETRKGADMSKAREASFVKTRVKVINLDTREVFNSISEASKKYSLKSTHISRVCKGKRNRTGGFRWMHYDEYMKIPCQEREEIHAKV